MNSIECTKQKIQEIIAQSTVPEDALHSRNTLTWLLKLKPDADEALRVSALVHDIDRAIENQKVHRAEFPDYEKFKSAHARNSAEMLREIMRECGVQEYIIDDVCHLVSRHETGGDPRADLIRDADSLSFFEVNLPHYFERNSREETQRRCIWGYRRLSENAKQYLTTFSYSNKALDDLVKRAIEESNE